jgi:hypothetical protein
MMGAVITKSLRAPALCRTEVLRYAGARQAGDEVTALLEECVAELCGALCYKVAYITLSCTVSGDICDFGAFCVRSSMLARNLAACSRVLIFAATLGAAPDRAIARYGVISPAKALMMQAIGAERIEALCDLFCGEYAREHGVTLGARFSPGYGNLSLEVQRDIFRLLQCPTRLGLCLNESLLMSPAKSVTAFVGVKV